MFSNKCYINMTFTRGATEAQAIGYEIEIEYEKYKNANYEV